MHLKCRCPIRVALAAVAAAALAAALPGCDWLKASGATTVRRGSPVLSGLTISPGQVLCERPFVVAFSYSDPQNDIALLSVSACMRGSSEQDCAAPPVIEDSVLWSTLSISGAAATYRGRFACSATKGTYTVSVRATDRDGHISNTLTGPITLF